MKNRLATALTVLFSLVFLTVGYQTNAQRHRINKRSASPVANRWYIFTGPDGDFTLDFPRQPKRQQDGQGPMTLIRGYDVTTDEGLHFSVNFQDIGGDPRSRQNNELAPDHEEVITAAAREQGKRVVQIHRLAKNVIETEYQMRVEETGADINYLERSILLKGRVYTLGCGRVAGGGDVDRSMCRRFFGSMRFLNRPL